MTEVPWDTEEGDKNIEMTEENTYCAGHSHLQSQCFLTE